MFGAKTQYRRNMSYQLGNFTYESPRHAPDTINLAQSSAGPPVTCTYKINDQLYITSRIKYMYSSFLVCLSRLILKASIMHLNINILFFIWSQKQNKCPSLRITSILFLQPKVSRALRAPEMCVDCSPPSLSYTPDIIKESTQLG